MENNYAAIWKMFLDDYAGYADSLCNAGVEEDLAFGFKKGLGVIMSLFMSIFLRADSYEEALDEILDDVTRAKVELKFQEIFDEKEKTMLEDMERMRKEEKEVLDPRKYLKVVKD